RRATTLPYTALFRSREDEPDRARIGEQVERGAERVDDEVGGEVAVELLLLPGLLAGLLFGQRHGSGEAMDGQATSRRLRRFGAVDRKSTRLNSSHVK